jgi:hypothetical protein
MPKAFSNEKAFFVQLILLRLICQYSILCREIMTDEKST